MPPRPTVVTRTEVANPCWVGPGTDHGWELSDRGNGGIPVRLRDHLTRRRAAQTILAVGGAFAAGVPGVAWAHVYLDRAEPASGVIAAFPSQLALTFSGPLDRGSSIRLLDAAGMDVLAAPGGIDPSDRTRLVAAVPDCPPGAYTVAWVAVSAEDGHAAPGFHGVLVGGAAPPLNGADPVATDGGVADLEVGVTPTLLADGGVLWTVRTGGPSAASVQRVALTFMPPVADLGAVQVATVIDDAGNRSAQWLPTLLGEWRVEAVVRRAGVPDDVRQRFRWIAADAPS